MDVREAAKANPDDDSGNCQSCVLAYYARRLGYPVVARPFPEKGTDEWRIAMEIGAHRERAWIDPETGKHPGFEPYDEGRMYDARSYHEYLETTVRAGAQYELGFTVKPWSGSIMDTTSHVICVDRDEAGRLRFIDPQSEKVESTYKERADVLEKVRFHGISNDPNTPKLLRVDGLMLKDTVANALLRKEK